MDADLRRHDSNTDDSLVHLSFAHLSFEIIFETVYSS